MFVSQQKARSQMCAWFSLHVHTFVTQHKAHSQMCPCLCKCRTANICVNLPNLGDSGFLFEYFFILAPIHLGCKQKYHGELQHTTCCSL